jgi:hypothetical protein
VKSKPPQATLGSAWSLDGASIAQWLAFGLLCLNILLNQPFTPIFPVLVASWAVLFFLPARLRLQMCQGMRTYVTPGRVVALFTVLVVYVFFIKFRFSLWNMVLFNDDYTTGYAASARYLETLKQGGLFGWDSKLLGGFCTAAEAPMNKSMFLLPFALVMGAARGYHVLILTGYLAFPFLCYWYARTAFGGKWVAPLTFAFSSVFLISFFRNFLAFGMVDALLGLDFFILNLVLYEKVKRGSRWASFFLCLTISLTMYAHVGFLFVSVLFIAVELALDFSKPLLVRTALVFVFALLMSLHNTFYFVYYYGYFSASPGSYGPADHTVAAVLRSTAQYYGDMLNPLTSLTIKFRLESLAVALLPVLVYLAVKGERPVRKLAVFAVGAVVIQGACNLPVAGLLASRIDYTLALILSVLLALVSASQLKSGRLHGLVLVPLLLTPTINTHTYFPFTHIPSIAEAASGVLEAVSRLDGNMILVESSSHLNAFTSEKDRSERPVLEGHWESLLAMESGRRLLCSSEEGYGYSGDRKAMLNSGAFRGRPIQEANVADIMEGLRKWGVRYLVVWTKRSMAYLAADTVHFRLVLSGSPVQIFEFLQSDPRSVAVGRGEGALEDQDYFAKTVTFAGVQQGDTAVIRQNYFPSWEARYRGQRIPILCRDGQMAVVMPASGNLVVDLRFPKYHRFTVIAVTAAVAALMVFVVFPGMRRGRAPAGAVRNRTSPQERSS